MNILLLGSGGREHALAWKIAQSTKLDKLYIAPGNAGTASVGINLAISNDDFEGIKNCCLEKEITMVIVGAEKPLVDGIVDYFEQDPQLQHIPIIGPNKEAAQLEGSKDFSKKMMQKYGIPTAMYQTITNENIQEGIDFLQSLTPPYVLKADGLAAGKGVVILDKLAEAKEELNNMLGGKFGKAGNKVVIEEFLDGIECSVFIITDGKNYKILPTAKDYKRIGEDNTGANTGGMGAISPVSFANNDFMQQVEKNIIQPTLKGLQQEGITYKGFIFFGLIKVADKPYVIEYNARMGDPETEVVIPRIESDIVELFEGVAHENLNEKILNIDPRYATTVMLVSKGYPDTYEIGKSITGLSDVTNSLIFHAGTKKQGEQLLTNGGRVLTITSYGDTMQQALKQSYSNANKVLFDGKYYRKDIGFDLT